MINFHYNMMMVDFALKATIPKRSECVQRQKYTQEISRYKVIEAMREREGLPEWERKCAFCNVRFDSQRKQQIHLVEYHHSEPSLHLEVIRTRPFETAAQRQKRQRKSQKGQRKRMETLLKIN